MADSNAARKFYGDLLGFKLTGRTEFSPNPAMSDFAGTPQETQLRALNVTARGTNPLVFYEFKDLPGAALPFRIHDPGAPAISFRVKDLDGLIRRLRAARTPIVSARGRAVQLVPESWSIFVRDPNGIYVELYEATR
jgi:catechol 2,3-dioxygenase-like lactoylglutathione lyase family enzyme